MSTWWRSRRCPACDHLAHPPGRCAQCWINGTAIADCRYALDAQSKREEGKLRRRVHQGQA